MRSQKPDEVFDADGKLRPELKELAPTGTRRMSANPHANGGILKRALRMPDFRVHAVPVDRPACVEAENTRPLGALLRDVMKMNMDNFRVFGPDVLLVSLGLDTFENDPISDFKLKSTDYLRMGETIAKLGKPTLFVFEGGYDLESLAENTVNVLEGFLQTAPKI